MSVVTYILTHREPRKCLLRTAPLVAKVRAPMTMMRMKLIGFYHIVLISMGNAHVIRKGRETGQTSGATKCVNYCTNGTGDSSPLTNMVDVLRSAHAVHNLVVAVKIGLVLRLPYGTMCCSLRPLPRNPIIMYSLLLDEPHLSTTHVKGSDSLLLGVKVNMKCPPPPSQKKLVVRVNITPTMATGAFQRGRDRLRPRSGKKRAGAVRSKSDVVVYWDGGLPPVGRGT